MYVYDGLSLLAVFPLFVPPSPNDQSHVVGDPVDVSINCTVRGAVPEVGDAVNEATNGVAVVVAVVVAAIGAFTVMVWVAVLVLLPAELVAMRDAL